MAPVIVMTVPPVVTIEPLAVTVVAVGTPYEVLAADATEDWPAIVRIQARFAPTPTGTLHCTVVSVRTEQAVAFSSVPTGPQLALTTPGGVDKGPKLVPVRVKNG